MHKFAICLDNSEYPTSLDKRKLYEILPDPEAAKHHQLRAIDESGEDYLFPDHIFLGIPLSEQVEKRVLLAA